MKIANPDKNLFKNADTYAKFSVEICRNPNLLEIQNIMGKILL